MQKNSVFLRGAMGALCLAISPLSIAASCCGGGNASTLVLPKTGQHMIDVSFDWEAYDGFWNQDGETRNDPQGAELAQQRLNIGYAFRLADNWQASVILPVVHNDNDYPGVQASNTALGDTTLSVWYETFDQITCVWQVNSLADLKPAIYMGSSLVIPTGLSAYSDDADNSFETTGKGFYRWDANLIVEKTVYPWTVNFQAAYGQHFERPVNREFGNAIEPYDVKLGDRRFLSASLAYTHFLEDLDSVTMSLALSDLNQAKGEINGVRDDNSGFEKRSVALTTSYSSTDQSWIVKATWSHAIDKDDWGENFPISDIFTLGVSYVFR